MKKPINTLFIYALSLVSALTVVSCSEADREVMWDKEYASVCFEPDSVTDISGILTHKDSVMTVSFSLQESDVAEYTVQVPVMVTGMPTAYDRTFSVLTDSEGSTAVAGTHYKALQQTYTMPAGSVCTLIPITVYRTADMQDGYKELRLTVTTSTDFPSLIIAEKAAMRLRISDQLEEPDWWSKWFAKGWFGKYSRRKYQQWLSIYGPNALGDAPGTGDYAWGAPEIAYYHNLLREYFIENPTTDEDGVLIEVPILR